MGFLQNLDIAAIIIAIMALGCFIRGFFKGVGGMLWSFLILAISVAASVLLAKPLGASIFNSGFGSKIGSEPVCVALASVIVFGVIYGIGKFIWSIIRFVRRHSRKKPSIGSRLFGALLALLFIAASCWVFALYANAFLLFDNRLRDILVFLTKVDREGWGFSKWLITSDFKYFLIINYWSLQ